MQKRNNIIVLSLILAAMIASGCGGAQSSASPAVTTAAGAEVRVAADGKEYLETLKKVFHEYAECSYPLTDHLEAKDFDAAKKDLDNMEAALSKVENITPPEQYADQQENQYFHSNASIPSEDAPPPGNASTAFPGASQGITFCPLHRRDRLPGRARLRRRSPRASGCRTARSACCSNPSRPACLP